MHFLVRTSRAHHRQPGRSPKLPSDQADEFVKHRCLLRSTPPRMPTSRTNAA